MEEDTRPEIPQAFELTLVDQHGKVLQRGKTLSVPQIPGTTPVLEIAPADTYWSGTAWLPLPAQPSLNHVFDWATKTWSDPRGFEELRAALMTAVTAKRWAVENGGLTLPGGIRVLTGKSDQDRITSVIVNSEIAGIESVDFKADSGWVTVTIAELKQLARAIALHVQACFTAERAHHEAIQALTTSAQARAYDVAEGWPN